MTEGTSPPDGRYESAEIPGADVSETKIAEGLRNQRRRYVLYYLRRHGETSLADLAEQIAAWELGVPTDCVQPNQRKSAYSALHQTHLPHLQRLGVVRYDSGDSRVALTEAADGLELYVAADYFDHEQWHWRYLALSLLGTTFVLLNVGGVVPFAAFSTSLSLLCIDVAFLGVAVMHAVSHRRWRTRFEDARPDYIVEWET